MRTSLRKYAVFLATIFTFAISFQTGAQITGASAVCVNGTTNLVAPITTITGGTVTTVGAFKVHTFTSGSTFFIPNGININAELLVVAGGGGGGKRHAGGGGAGGLIYSASYNASGTQNVVVGAGGLGSQLEPNNGANGANSAFGTVIATGGGGGGTNNIPANSGGSGGGGSNGSFGGAGIVGQGFEGGNQNNGQGCCFAMGNGGGGATGAAASTAGLLGSNGGPGFTTSMTGISQSFAGGGGGGQGVVTAANYLGGIGGGGQGGNTVNMQGANGTPNTGGGGGGGGATSALSGNGGDGGSGIVIVKYAQAGTGTWTSSNPAVATVNASTGAVTGVTAGTATITYSVTVGGVVNNYTKVITVNALPYANIKANGPLAFCAGGNVGLSAETYALQFNGNWVSVANGYAATDDITYEATVNASVYTAGDFNVVMNHNSYVAGAIHFQFTSGLLQFSVGGNAPNDQYCSIPFTAGTTYRIAAVYSKAGKYVKFYVNGVLTNTATYTFTNSIVGNSAYTIGAWNGGRFFHGTIDELRVWNTIRTDAQVLADAAPVPIATGTANLIRYYRFDEGTGTVTSDDAGSAGGILSATPPTWVSTTPAGQTYLWTNGLATANISATTAGTYGVTVTSASGCVSTSETKIVTVNALPVITASNNNPVVGSALNLSVTAGTTYSWTGPNGFTSALQNPTIATSTLANAGIYSVTVTNASGCSAIATTTVAVINPVGPAGINSGILMWLDGSDIDADANAANDPASGATLNIWKDKSGLTNNATTIVGQSPINFITNQINGKSVARFTRTNDAIGSALQATNVDIRAIANPAVTMFTVYKTGAHGNTGQGQALWGNDNGNWDRFFYNSWNFTDDGIVSLGTVNPSNVAIPGAGTTGAVRLMTAVYNNLVPLGSAIYFNGAVATKFTDNTDPSAAQTNLKIGYDGDNGSYNGDIAEMIVYKRKLTDCEILQINQYLGAKYGVTFTSATITAPVTTVCSPATATLTASAGDTYQWSKDGVAIPSATAATYAAATTGSYTVAITTAGCTATSLATVVTVNPLPTATISGATNVCINTGSPLVTFTGANGTAPYTFTYTINGGAQQTVTSTGNTATVAAPTGVVGTFTYTLVSVKDASATTCSNTITGSSVVVTIRAIPTISGITGTTSICTGNSTTLTAASAFVGAQFKWYDAATAGNLLASGASLTTDVLSNTTNYYVELTATPFVCAATRTLVTVTVIPNNTIALSSSVGTDAQTILINNPIANIVYTTTGATGVNFTGLPTGVTAVLTGNSLVISGTATVTGVYNYTINLTGGCGTTTQNGSITVNQPAAIASCPFTGYQQFFASANNCSAIATYAPTFSGFPAPQVTYTFTGATNATGSGTGSGSAFNVGTTTVTITAANSVNSTTCSFDITVIDKNPPTAITKNITVYLDALGQATIAPSDVNNGSSDNCGTVNLSLENIGKICGTGNEGNNVTLTAPVGAVFTAIDFASYGTPNGTCGNFSIGNCNATNSVSVVSPYLIGKNSGTIPAFNSIFGDPCGGTVKRLYIQASFKGGVSSMNSFNCSNLGANTVNLIVTDANGNASSATAIVTVADNIAPTIVAPSNISVIATSSLGTIVNYAEPVGTDNTTCVTTVRTAGFASGTRFPIGTSTVTYTATDASGNSKSASFTVTVSGLAPVIVKPADKVVASPANQCAANVSFAATETIGVPASTITYKENGVPVISGASFSVGLHTITATATNAVGTSSTTFTINVNDVTPPVFTSTASILTANNAGVVQATSASGAVVMYSIPAATDNCSGLVSVTSVPASGSVFAIGTTTVTVVARDASSNIASTSFDITVVGVAPSIVKPDDISVKSPLGECGANVDFAATESNAIPASTISYTEDGNEVVSGANFSVGVHTITATATNTIGSTSVDFTITVIDDQLPTIIAPADITIENTQVENATGSCGAINVQLGDPIVSDNCTVADFYPDHNRNFPVGTTEVVWTVVDASGNTATAIQHVTVIDTEKPLIRKARDWGREGGPAEPGKCGTSNIASLHLGVPGTASTFEAYDNCEIASITSNAPTFFPVGLTIVTYTVTDIHGNFSTVDEEVTVTDFEAPVIASVADINVNATSANGAVVEYAIPVGTDNCSAATTVMTEGLASGSTFPIGTTVVTYTVTDASGLTASTTFNVTVTGIAPGVVTTQNYLSNSETGKCSASVAFAATETTAKPASIITYTENGLPVSSGNQFTVGVHTITATASNAVGTSSADFTITVVDHQAPIAKTKNITLGLGTAVGGLVSITAADVNNGSTDACGIASMTVTPASFGCGNIGNNTVTLTVTDVNGNVSTTTAVVTVVDDKGPIAVLPTITGQCYATVLTLKKGEHEEDQDGDDNKIDLEHYTLVPPTAMDNCSGLIKGTTTDPLTYYNQGDHVIYWKFVDARGNVSIIEQHVIVADTYAPVPKRATLPTLTGQCSVSIAAGNSSDDDGDDNDGGDEDHGKTPWAKDNCSGWIKGTTTDPLTYTVQGTYTITWNFNDGHGNISIQTQTVIVKDITKPKINAPKDKTIACGSSILPAVTGMATATDNCATPVITFTDVNNGTQITRTWTATDAAGNTSTDVQIIKLTPAFTAAVASTPTSTVYTGGSNTNLYLGYGAQSTTLSVTGLPTGSYTYSWSGANISNTSSATPVFTASAAGVTTIYVTVTNANGCSSTASIAICVTDVRVPGSNGAMVYVCHQGTGKTGGTQTLSVPVAQVAAHLNNTCTNGKGGDRLGSCSSNPCSTNTTVSAVDPKSQDAIEIVTLKSDVAATPATEDLTVTVMPNPSTTYFTLKFVSKDMKTPISLRVMDASGRAIDAKQQIDPSSTIQIGHSYPSGTFYTEVIQGNKRKTVQLIKARG